MKGFLLGAALALLIAGPGAACPLDEAMVLVLSHHPVLISERAELESILVKSRWSADLNLSLTETTRGGSGIASGQVGVSISIPLVGGAYEREQAKALSVYDQARSRVRKEFVDKISELRVLSLRVELTKERRDFWRDQTEYYRQAVEDGVGEPDRLWSQAGSLQEADHAYRGALLNLETGLDEVAREFGGAEWMSLRDLLVEIAS